MKQRGSKPDRTGFLGGGSRLGPVGENSPQREMLQFRARHMQFEPRLKIAPLLFLIQLLKASTRVKHRRRQSFRRPQRLVLTEAWLGRA